MGTVKNCMDMGAKTVYNNYLYFLELFGLPVT